MYLWLILTFPSVENHPASEDTVTDGSVSLRGNRTTAVQTLFSNLFGLIVVTALNFQDKIEFPSFL